MSLSLEIDLTGLVCVQKRVHDVSKLMSWRCWCGLACVHVGSYENCFIFFLPNPVLFFIFPVFLFVLLAKINVSAKNMSK